MAGHSFSPQSSAELYRLCEIPRRCSYLPDQTAALEYRGYGRLTPGQLESFLARGWRRFGMDIFRPACSGCFQCIPLRIDVAEFHPDKSQRRTLRKNAHVSMTLHPATVSREHVTLYNDWHRDMTSRKGWPPQQLTPEEYARSFLIGDYPSLHEMRYRVDTQLVGIGLVDCLPRSISSVYFYHAPDWRSLSPGTFSVLCEIELARQMKLDYVYMGYLIRNCPSMAYKGSFRPHEILLSRPADEEQPAWLKPETESYNVPTLDGADSPNSSGDDDGPADND